MRLLYDVEARLRAIVIKVVEVFVPIPNHRIEVQRIRMTTRIPLLRPGQTAEYNTK